MRKVQGMRASSQDLLFVWILAELGEVGAAVDHALLNLEDDARQ